MPVPSTMADLSVTATSNSPAGSDAIGNTLDDYLRAIQSILRSTQAVSSSTIASASTTAIGGSDAEVVTITGSGTINSFGTVSAGIRRVLRFTGAATITDSANIVLPGGNITTAADDVLVFRSLGSGVWTLEASAKAVVADGSITYAKIQDVSATDKLLGRSSSGAGDIEEIDCTAAGRALLDDADAAAQRVTLQIPVEYYVAVSDEVTAITTGAAKVTFYVTRAFTLTSVFAGLTTQGTTGTTVDINKNGASIFSTLLTIDANEDTSLTAATPAVISTTSFAAGDKITVDIDVAGTNAKGLKVSLIGRVA